MNVASGPLAALFGSSGLTAFQYPLDLGSDPARKHFVQFKIKNIQPTTFNVVKTAVNSLSSAPSVISSYYNGIVNNGLKSVAPQILEKIGEGTKTLENLLVNLQPQTSKATAAISLYMPDTLSMNYNQNYSVLSLSDATNGLSRKAGQISSVVDGLIQYNNTHKNGASMAGAINSLGGDTSAYIAEEGLQKIDGAFGTNATPIILNKMGRAINPQLQMIYQGVGLRTFGMEFIFTPKSQEEAAQVTAIVNAFTYAQAPTVQDGPGTYFTPPSIFEITFQRANSNSLSPMFNTLQSELNNVVSGANLGNIAAGIFGANMAQSLTLENDRVFKVSDCVLESMTVDYAPNGWVAYNDGAPVQTRLILSFRETTILDRTKLQLGGAR